MVMLLIDNDDHFCRDLIVSFQSIQKDILIAHDQAKAFCLISQHKPKKVVLEQHLDGVSGIDLIKPILKIDSTIKIIVMSRYGSIADAVNAVKLGAFNYLPRPISASALNRAFKTSSGLIDNTTSKHKQPMSIKRFEWEYIKTVLVSMNGNISATARELGLNRRTLQRKLKKYPSID